MPTLNWIGKDKIVNHDKEVPFRLMKKVKKFSLGKSENLIVEGDNLEALKALMPFYYGKIKCIYIDPPYNTGSEKWIYNDNANSSRIKEWIGKVVGPEGEDLTRHDKWLCMMYPRLKLLRDLLSDEGVIFVSIDQNEIFNLKPIMDEIFPSNFLGTISVVNNWKGRSDDDYIATCNEYLMIYVKNKLNFKMGGFLLTAEKLKEYDQKDKWGKYKEVGFRKTGKGWRRIDRKDMFYPIYYNSKRKIISLNKISNSIKILPLTKDGLEGRWRWGKDTFLKKYKKDIIVRLIKSGEYRIFTKMRLNRDDGNERTLLPKSTWIDPKYDTAKGAKMLKEVFQTKEDFFENPKPVEFIKDIIFIVTDKDDTILDSFAGSGTTGHAVLDLNKKDGGNRKFILVEMEPKIAKEITAERIKRVSKGYSYKKTNGGKTKVEGLGGGFEYVQLGSPLFNENGLINKEVRFNDLAQYVYFTETFTNLDKAKIKENYIGEYNNSEYYLLFKGIDKNILDRKFLSKIKKNKNRKIIYADKCLLDDEILKEHNIIFKQIPYRIKVY